MYQRKTQPVAAQLLHGGHEHVVVAGFDKVVAASERVQVGDVAGQAGVDGMMTGRLQSLRSALVDETQCFVATHAGHMDVQPHNTKARHVTSGHLMVQTSHALSLLSTVCSLTLALTSANA